MAKTPAKTAPNKHRRRVPPEAWGKAKEVWQELLAAGKAVSENNPRFQEVQQTLSQRRVEVSAGTLYQMWHRPWNGHIPIKEAVKEDLRIAEAHARAELADLDQKIRGQVKDLLTNRLASLGQHESSVLRLCLAISSGVYMVQDEDGKPKPVKSGNGLYFTANTLLQRAEKAIAAKTSTLGAVRCIALTREILSLGDQLQKQAANSIELETKIRRNGALVLSDLLVQLDEDQLQETPEDQERTLDVIYAALGRRQARKEEEAAASATETKH
jgi:hypothetical protein